MAARRQLLGRFPLHRPNPMADAILVFPLFAVYQIGIVTGRGRNGVDLVTNGLFALSQRDLGSYLLLLLAMVVAYGLLLSWLRTRGRFRPADFLPVLVESGFYALSMGTVILLVMRFAVALLPGLALPPLAVADAGPFEVIVISAGAGLHEELVFRVLLLGGLARLATRRLGARGAWLAALALSSLLFALVHHVGPGAEPFTAAAFAYRGLAGVVFGLLYGYRGFAIAVWTHALYDVYVLSF